MGIRLRRAGSHIGPYIVTNVLGRGGSGDVYKVIDSQGRVAALKAVDVTANPAARTRLGREVAALMSVTHPSVPRVLDAQLDGPEPYVVFSMVEGESLADHVRRGGPLKGKKLADLADALASALAAAHTAGVVHRDVTPSNVMVGPKGPVLIDFGLAHRVDDPRLTREGLVSGTAGYVAPEVIDGAEPGMAADLWSWAATVCFAMSGDAPFGLGRGALGKTFAGEVTLPDAPGAPALAAALSLDPKRRPNPTVVVAALRGKTTVLPSKSDPASRPGQPLSGHLSVTRIFDLGDEVAAPGKERGGPPLPPIPVRRTGVIAAWTVAFAFAAAILPVAVFVLMCAVAIVGRVEHRRVATIAAMRAKRGARKADAVWATVGLPWHALRATGEVLPSAALGAVAGGGLAVLGWKLVTSGLLGVGSSPVAQTWGRAAALALGFVLAALVVWRGPLSSGTRDGVRRVAALTMRSTFVARVWVVIAITVAGMVIFALVWRTEPWWWPLPSLVEPVRPGA